MSDRGTTIRRVTIALAVAGAAAGVAWHRSRGPVVEVATVVADSVSDRVVASGRVLPPGRIRVGSVVLGTVVAVAVEDGQAVRQGQVLASLDDAEARAAVAQAEAQRQLAEARLAHTGGVGAKVALETVTQASAKMAQAKARLERERALLASGASTKENVDDAERAYDISLSAHAAALAQATSSSPRGGDYRAAVAEVARARAAVDAAAARLAQTRIVAPADGVVLERDVEPGDVVQPGHALLVLARAGATRLTVQVDEKNLSLLEIGQEALASADAFPGETFGARVSYLAPAVDAGRGTIEVRLEVERPPAYLRPDMTVSVVIDGGRREGVLLAPGGAVRDAATPDPYVLVVKDGVTVRRGVQVGLRAGDRIEIRAGLQAGDRVVLSAAKTVQAGRRVRARLVPESEAQRAL